MFTCPPFIWVVFAFVKVREKAKTHTQSCKTKVLQTKIIIPNATLLKVIYILRKNTNRSLF